MSRAIQVWKEVFVILWIIIRDKITCWWLLDVCDNPLAMIEYMKQSIKENPARRPMTKPPLVCVLCGAPWRDFYNNCECGGFCSWGEKKDGPPSSWDVSRDGQWTPKKPPASAYKGEG